MSTLLVDLDPAQREFFALAIEAAHVDVQAVKPNAHESHLPLTQLRSIVISGTRYDDKVASCTCAQLRLFRIADRAYTVCAEHGIQDIGLLRRVFATPGARKQIREAAQEAAR